eukprot:m.69681 g.69681  ORF g.69681 m.69681 type:complete len:269 (-) comp8279_c0_seq3:111-917(-)
MTNVGESDLRARIEGWESDDDEEEEVVVPISSAKLNFKENDKKKQASAARTWLLYINVLYVLIACLALGLVATALTKTPITLSSMSGVIGGFSLFLIIALFGLVGAWKHNRCLLLLYVVFLSIVFLVLFFSAIGAFNVARSSQQQNFAVKQLWCHANNYTKGEIQLSESCFGLYDENNIEEPCEAGVTLPQYCPKRCTTPHCEPVDPMDPPVQACGSCYDPLASVLKKVALLGGGVGITLSLTMFLGIWAAIVHRRNSLKPKAYHELL